MPFPYKTVLITGATAGIGQALAERMIASGIFVIAVGRREDRLRALVAKHGADKVAGETFDVADIDGMGEWAKSIIAKYPKLDCIVLNAGFQRTLDFTNPSSVSLPLVTSEVTTNYLSPLHMTTHFLPHLRDAHGPSGHPAAIVLVTSGLAVIPFPRCANYCATKSALHSLAWSLRTQLSGPSSPDTHHIRVIEIMPPAVQTELHSQQPDLVAAGQTKLGLPLEVYIDETWADLIAEGGGDEIVHSAHRERVGVIESKRREMYESFLAVMRKAGVEF